MEGIASSQEAAHQAALAEIHEFMSWWHLMYCEQFAATQEQAIKREIALATAFPPGLMPPKKPPDPTGAGHGSSVLQQGATRVVVVTDASVAEEVTVLSALYSILYVESIKLQKACHKDPDDTALTESLSLNWRARANLLRRKGQFASARLNKLYKEHMTAHDRAVEELAMNGGPNDMLALTLPLTGSPRGCPEAIVVRAFMSPDTPVENPFGDPPPVSRDVDRLLAPSSRTASHTTRYGEGSVSTTPRSPPSASDEGMQSVAAFVPMVTHPMSSMPSSAPPQQALGLDNFQDFMHGMYHTYLQGATQGGIPVQMAPMAPLLPLPPPPPPPLPRVDVPRGATPEINLNQGQVFDTPAGSFSLATTAVRGREVTLPLRISTNPAVEPNLRTPPMAPGPDGVPLAVVVERGAVAGAYSRVPIDASVPSASAAELEQQRQDVLQLYASQPHQATPALPLPPLAAALPGPATAGTYGTMTRTHVPRPSQLLPAACPRASSPTCFFQLLHHLDGEEDAWPDGCMVDETLSSPSPPLEAAALPLDGENAWPDGCMVDATLSFPSPPLEAAALPYWSAMPRNPDPWPSELPSTAAGPRASTPTCFFHLHQLLDGEDAWPDCCMVDASTAENVAASFHPNGYPADG